MPARKRANSADTGDNPGVNEEPMSAAEEPRAQTGGGTAYGEIAGGAPRKRATARKATPKRAAAKKSAGAKAPAKKAAAKKTAPKKAAAKKAPAKKAAAKKGASRTGSGATHRRTRAAGSNGTNGRVAGLPAGKMAADYGEAKRALATLWNDVTRQTYSTFNNVASRVERTFNDARQNINEMDVRYALERTQGKLKNLARSGQHSAQQMGRQARLLYQMLKDAVGGRFKVPWATVSAATAALLYFISPIDILPDFIPGAGLIDDALVISMAISLARMDLRRYLQEMNLDAKEYGL